MIHTSANREMKNSLSSAASGLVHACDRHFQTVADFLRRHSRVLSVMSRANHRRAMFVALFTLWLANTEALAADNPISYHYASVDGIKVFYREAGNPKRPTILLMHGIPTSSQMFRDLIPRLAADFHVIAPDFVGMGNSDAPSASAFDATQDNLSLFMEKFIRQTVPLPTILYMQDLGGPIGMRIATRHPEWISGLIFQNTPISLAGWRPERIKPMLALTGPVTDGERSEQANRNWPATDVYLYKTGARSPEALDPDAWAIDAYALNQPESRRIIAAYLADARLSFSLYPEWQSYLRERQPTTLVVWGTRDPVFDVAGVADIKNAVPAANVYLYETGHFALQEDGADIARRIITTFAH
ncbi:alpha/beta fold hydrolase [Pandoraea sputorum]|uniref:alpha/beta fold hydrolase n=1 Tax=Pandoraea sputorum TaxID=93222 RepID=UPI001CD7A7AF|nr:alpha/beta hydrolase [Pandoraea sputorum]